MDCGIAVKIFDMEYRLIGCEKNIYKSGSKARSKHLESIEWYFDCFNTCFKTLLCDNRLPYIKN